MKVLRSVVAIGLLAAALVVVLPVHAPVSVSYVYSESMEPTLSPGDGYVLRSTGDVSEDDVVTFWSESKGEFVTHRVVAVTADGFTTKGDANDVTDQTTGHPPVSRDAVVGEVVTVGGSVLVLPGFGRVVEAARSNRQPIVGVAVVVTLLSIRGRQTTGDGRPERGRRLRVGHAYLGAFVLVTAVVTALFVGTATTHRWDLVVTTYGSAGPAVGEPVAFDETVAARSGAVVDSFVHVRGLRNASVATAGGEYRVAGTVPARETPGVRTVTATTYRHPGVLPAAVRAALRAVHPLVAVTGAVVAALSGPFALAGVLADLRRPLRLPDWVERMP